MRRNYLGQCHCGKVSFEVEADLDGGPNLICNCTSCTMKGFIHHHVEKSAFKLLRGFDELKLYKFGTLSAEHYFCTCCGVESFYRSRSDPAMWDINIRCLKGADHGDPVNLYALNYQLNDGMHWDEAHAAKHARGDQPKIAQIYQAISWRLIAPALSVDPDLDVAAEFRKTWDPAAR